jgi:hypothetical protein
VLECLGPDDVIAASESSHAWHAAGLAEELWRPLCARESPLLGLLKVTNDARATGGAAPPCSWKRLFAQRRGLAQSVPWEVAGPVEDTPRDAGDYLLGVELTEKKTGRVLFAALAELGGPFKGDVCVIEGEAAAKGNVCKWPEIDFDRRPGPPLVSTFMFRKLDGKAFSLSRRMAWSSSVGPTVWFSSAHGLFGLVYELVLIAEDKLCTAIASLHVHMHDPEPQSDSDEPEFGGSQKHHSVKSLSGLLSVLERPAEQPRWV